MEALIEATDVTKHFAAPRSTRGGRPLAPPRAAGDGGDRR